MKKIIMTLAVAILIISGISNPIVEAKTKSKTKTIKVSATAYNEMGRTATGYNLRKHPKAKVIAVDPRVIPLGSKVKIPGYGTAIARDTGGAIKGKKIDVHFKSRHQALKWGKKRIKIIVYKK